MVHLQAHLGAGAEEIAEASTLSGFTFLGFLTFAGLAEASPEAIAEADSAADEVPAKAGEEDRTITKTAINLDILIPLFN
jgi:D-serine deaminase-like pyridoxal phosphate-dependent protein